ncbi:hypothetical protein [Arthrobacter castelli]|uniref:hypothetical protein n=1 Tax=Arthrobacter castelli TaxID=271431 RepID=UPI000425CCD2|nr:hypothetical protein [Arthrobacter castelli]
MGSDVPTEERALVTLVGAHYVDHHALIAEDAQRWSPEQWARAMFEDSRSLLKRMRDLGLLGALLSPPQPEGRVAGWMVVDTAAGWLRMESTSQLTSDQVVVRVDAEGASLTTAVRYERRGSRIVWRLISTQHRRFAPRVLRRAHRLLASE